jgi:hypothetical protein
VDVSVSIPVSRCEGISAAQIRNRLDWPDLVPVPCAVFRVQFQLWVGYQVLLEIFSVRA